LKNVSKALVNILRKKIKLFNILILVFSFILDIAKIVSISLKWGMKLGDNLATYANASDFICLSSVKLNLRVCKVNDEEIHARCYDMTKLNRINLVLLKSIRSCFFSTKEGLSTTRKQN